MEARKKRAFPNRKQDMKSVFALLDFVQCHDNSKIWLSEAAFTHDEIQPDLYRPKRSFGQGNIFTSVCHSVHRGGLQIFGGVSNFSGGGGGADPGGVPLIIRGGFLQIFGGGRLHRNTVNVRPVHILLECILVYFKISIRYSL